LKSRARNRRRVADKTRRLAYVCGMAEFNVTAKTIGTVALIAVLVAILGAAGWYAAQAWVNVSGPPMPTTGYVAMTLGVIFSLVVGCGLMALLFYSNRYGYDEPPNEPRQDRDGQ
jgi:hypothetical protein